MESVKKIRSALGIEREAVGVKYTDESLAAEPSGARYAVCNGMLEAGGHPANFLLGIYGVRPWTCPGGSSQSPVSL